MKKVSNEKFCPDICKIILRFISHPLADIIHKITKVRILDCNTNTFRRIKIQFIFPYQNQFIQYRYDGSTFSLYKNGLNKYLGCENQDILTLV